MGSMPTGWRKCRLPSSCPRKALGKARPTVEHACSACCRSISCDSSGLPACSRRGQREVATTPYDVMNAKVLRKRAIEFQHAGKCVYAMTQIRHAKMLVGRRRAPPAAAAQVAATSTYL